MLLREEAEESKAGWHLRMLARGSFDSLVPRYTLSNRAQSGPSTDDKARPNPKIFKTWWASGVLEDIR